MDEIARSMLRYEMRLAFGGPRLVERPRHEHDRAMEAHWLEMARRLGRMPYHEAPGFADDRRWLNDGKWKPRRRSIAGHEKAYGLFCRSHWRYLWLAMKAAWWSGWNEAVGTTYQTTPPGASRNHAVVSGITT